MRKLVCPRFPQFQACVSPLGQLHSRPLFGGYSLAIDDTVFAMVAEGNIYLKANYELVSGLSAYLDLQYRHINYKINGLNDKYNWTATTPGMQKLDIDEDFDFFNPKAGLSWQIDRNHRL